jgi:hypothetical protein
MIEEAMRRKPADKGAWWLVSWLMREASDLPVARQEGIQRELTRMFNDGRTR